MLDPSKMTCFDTIPGWCSSHIFEASGYIFVASSHIFEASSHIFEVSSHIFEASSHIYDGFYENKAISASIEVEVELS